MVPDANPTQFVMDRTTVRQETRTQAQPVLVLVLETSMMSEPTFDHEGLDVHRFSVDYGAFSYRKAKSFTGIHRPAPDQRLRATQSIPLNIAEGNGKQSLKDKNRFVDIARDSALECVSIDDVLDICDAIDDESNRRDKSDLKRIVSMLPRLIQEPQTVSEDSIEYEYEYRDAEYEYEAGRNAQSLRTKRCTQAAIGSGLKVESRSSPLGDLDCSPQPERSANWNQGKPIETDERFAGSGARSGRARSRVGANADVEMTPNQTSFCGVLGRWRQPIGQSRQAWPRPRWVPRRRHWALPGRMCDRTRDVRREFDNRQPRGIQC